MFKYAVFDIKPTYDHNKFSSQISYYTSQKFRWVVGERQTYAWEGVDPPWPSHRTNPGPD